MCIYPPTTLFFVRFSVIKPHRFILPFVCLILGSGNVVVAPGWSLVGYALQILFISSCFVGGFKNVCVVISDLNKKLPSRSGFPTTETV